jgi:tetratricopeptide (TPR) repeat protein
MIMDTHDTHSDRLSEYMDDELAPADRVAIETHLGACASCRATLAELRDVTSRAGSLPDTPPAADLWPGVAARLAGGRVVTFPRRFSFTLPQLIAAGLALMVLSGGMVWLARLGGTQTDIPAVGASVPAVALANFADGPYDEAIADLQRTLEAGRTKLDAETIRVLEANLASIDAAIEQCRRALAVDPANMYLNGHLADAKKRKLGLLRRATSLTELGS